MDCAYRSETEEGTTPEGESIYLCNLHKRNCKLEGKARRLLVCASCKDRLCLSDDNFADKWKDPLIITDRNKSHVDALRGMLAGGKAFLLAGGPSTNDQPIEELSGRGFFSLAVNNMAGHPRLKPQAFVCSDPPCKFSHSIWLDPGIMKFAPIPKMSGGRAVLHRKDKDGTFVKMKKRVSECPNVWGFSRESYLYPDHRFFTSPCACWGNHNAGVKKTGELKTVCTLLLGLRILYYLGARRIFLVGVDFTMSPENGYSFGQNRDSGAATSNNYLFSVVNDWLCRMAENCTFEKFGLEVYNCNEHSSLKAFEYVPFEEALINARGIVEKSPNLALWYEDSKQAKIEDEVDVTAF